MVVEIGEVKDLTITTADGKKLEKEDALKRLGKGAIVVISGDGKPVSPTFLKVFKDDTLVLASPELAGPQFPTAIDRRGFRPVPVPIQPGGAQILPLPPGGVQGGVIQIQVGPGGVIQAVPPVPPPAEKPVVKPPEK
jgi:hypothetical protein